MEGSEGLKHRKRYIEIKCHGVNKDTTKTFPNKKKENQTKKEKCECYRQKDGYFQKHNLYCQTENTKRIEKQMLEDRIKHEKLENYLIGNLIKKVMAEGDDKNLKNELKEGLKDEDLRKFMKELKMSQVNSKRKANLDYNMKEYNRHLISQQPKSRRTRHLEDACGRKDKRDLSDDISCKDFRITKRRHLVDPNFNQTKNNVKGRCDRSVNVKEVEERVNSSHTEYGFQIGKSYGDNTSNSHRTKPVKSMKSRLLKEYNDAYEQAEIKRKIRYKTHECKCARSHDYQLLDKVPAGYAITERRKTKLQFDEGDKTQCDCKNRDNPMESRYKIVLSEVTPSDANLQVTNNSNYCHSYPRPSCSPPSPSPPPPPPPSPPPPTPSPPPPSPPPPCHPTPPPCDPPPPPCDPPPPPFHPPPPPCHPPTPPCCPLPPCYPPPSSPPSPSCFFYPPPSPPLSSPPPSPDFFFYPPPCPPPPCSSLPFLPSCCPCCPCCSPQCCHSCCFPYPPSNHCSSFPTTDYSHLCSPFPSLDYFNFCSHFPYTDLKPSPPSLSPPCSIFTPPPPFRCFPGHQPKCDQPLPPSLRPCTCICT